jgi:O-antigen/teichoic acid export membrane protein
MSDKSLSEKTLVVVFSRVLTSLIDLTTAVFIARLLSKTDFAIVGYLLMVYEVARYVATLGFPESIFYYFEKLTKNYRKAFAIQTSVILVVTGILSAIIILLIMLFTDSLITKFDPLVRESIKALLPIIAGVAVLEIPTWSVHNVLLASDRQKEAGWYQIITSIMSFMALIGPLALGYSVEIAIYSMLIYAGIRFVGSFIWMWLILPNGDLKTPTGNLKEQISFSIPLGISALVNQFNKWADKSIVAFFLTEQAFADYLIGAQEVPIIRVIPFAVGSVLISRYVYYQLNNKKEELIELWHKGIKKVLILIIPLSIFFVVVAPQFISLLFESGDTNYQNAILPFQIYNLIILIRVAHFGGILQAFADTKGILKLSIQLVVLNMVLSIPFTLLFGIVGTATGTLLANIINWVFTVKRIGRHLEIKAKKVIPFFYYSKVLGLSITIGVIIYFFNAYFLSTNLISISVSFIFYIVFYLLFGNIFKILSKSDWINLKSLISFKFLWK